MRKRNKKRRANKERKLCEENFGSYFPAFSFELSGH
jgi:hypothetical protein